MYEDLTTQNIKRDALEAIDPAAVISNIAGS